MKGIFLIDPRAMSAKSLELLKAYLSQNPDFSGVFHDKNSGQVYSCTYKEKPVRFQVKSKLLLRQKSKLHNHYQYPEFAVIGDEVGSGRYGVVNDISGSVSLALQPTALFGFKAKHHKSVVKTQYHFSDYPSEYASHEFKLLAKTSYARPKNFSLDGDNFISYIVSKKIAGKSFAQVLSDDLSGAVRISLSDRFRLSINILRALKEDVHDRGIIHRDIKPENVMISNNLTAYLIDFGLSRDSGDDNNDGARCGTLTFISPDVVKTNGQGISSLDERSDIYSTGKLLSLLWGASNPLLDDERFNDITKILTFILNGEAPEFFKNIQLPSSFSDSAKTEVAFVVNGMMAVSRRKRMTLNDAISRFELLRIGVVAADIPENMKKGFYDAAEISARFRSELLMFSQSDHYTLTGMIKMIAAAALQLDDNPFAVREFIESIGISDSGIKRRPELLELCDKFLVTINNYKSVFQSLLFTIKKQIENEKYLSNNMSRDRLINYQHLQYLILHELDKLSVGRRNFSDLIFLEDRLSNKFHSFMRLKYETAFLTGWTKNHHLPEMQHCLTMFCDDIRPDYMRNQLRLFLAYAVLSFVKNYAASHHYSLFHTPPKMPSSAVEYASSLFSAIVSAASDEQLVMLIRELEPPKGVFHYLERKLHQQVLDVIEEEEHRFTSKMYY